MARRLSKALTNKCHMTTPGSDTSFSKMFFVARTAVVRYKSPFKGFLKKQTTTLKWKRFGVWYSDVSRMFSMLFPNSDAEGKFFNWAVNPNM